MEKTVLISIPLEDLQNLITSSVKEGLNKANTSTPPTEKLLTVKEASVFVSLSVPTIYGLCQKREIPYSKKGKRLYFSTKELLEWIKDGRRRTTREIREAVNQKGAPFKTE